MELLYICTIVNWPRNKVSRRRVRGEELGLEPPGGVRHPDEAQ